MNQGFTDFEGPGDAVTCTASNLNATNRGILTGTWSIDGTGTAMKFALAAAMGLLYTGGPLADDSIVSPGAGTMGVRYSTDSEKAYITRHVAGIGNTVPNDEFTSGIWFRSDLPDNDASNLDVYTVYGLGAVNFANAKYLQSPEGNRCFQLEVGGGGGTDNIEVLANTWYWLEIRYRNGAGAQHELRIYNTSGELVGTLSETGNNAGKASYISIGQASDNIPTPGYFCDFDSLLFDYDGGEVLPGSLADFARMNQTANTDPVTELVRRAAVVNGVAGTIADAIIHHSGPYPRHPEKGYAYAKHGTPQKYAYVFPGTLTLGQAQVSRNALT